MGLTLLEPQFRFWGQTTQISSSLSRKRDCGSKGVKKQVHKGNILYEYIYIYIIIGLLLSFSFIIIGYGQHRWVVATWC